MVDDKLLLSFAFPLKAHKKQAPPTKKDTPSPNLPPFPPPPPQKRREPNPSKLPQGPFGYPNVGTQKPFWLPKQRQRDKLQAPTSPPPPTKKRRGPRWSPKNPPAGAANRQWGSRARPGTKRRRLPAWRSRGCSASACLLRGEPPPAPHENKQSPTQPKRERVISPVFASQAKQRRRGDFLHPQKNTDFPTSIGSPIQILHHIF